MKALAYGSILIHFVMAVDDPLPAFFSSGSLLASCTYGHTFLGTGIVKPHGVDVSGVYESILFFRQNERSYPSVPGKAFEHPGQFLHSSPYCLMRAICCSTPCDTKQAFGYFGAVGLISVDPRVVLFGDKFAVFHCLYAGSARKCRAKAKCFGYIHGDCFL